MKPKEGISLAPRSVPASKEKPHRKYRLAHKLCTLKTYSFVQLDFYWLKEKLKIYIGTRREAGAANAKNPDHKSMFLVNTTNKLQKSPITFHVMHCEDLLKNTSFLSVFK